MKRLILMLSTLGGLAGPALAQDAPPPPSDARSVAGGPPPATEPHEMRRGPGGPGGDRHGPPPPSKAARFVVELGDGRRVEIKCADDEPMKACADIATTMLERIAPPSP